MKREKQVFHAAFTVGGGGHGDLGPVVQASIKRLG